MQSNREMKNEEDPTNGELCNFAEMSRQDIVYVQRKKYMNEGLNFASDALEQVVDLSLSLHVLCDLL